VFVPVGSLEQHGPHLPLGTDAVIAESISMRAAELLGGNVTVTPVISFGASGEHQMFPGTGSIGTDALQVVLVELARSLRTWARRVVFINAHGGNTDSLVAAVGQLLCEGHDIGWLACMTEEMDAHAGYTETSLMLHLRPDSVRLDLAEAGNTAPIWELLPILVRDGVAAVSANGVLGDPSGASAEAGRRCLDAMAAHVVRVAPAGEPDERGVLVLAAQPA
jgi:creatinine amidohydrolase